MLDSQVIDCPYCGESIDILIDPSVANQRYVEDCQVCCRPMVVCVSVDAAGDAKVVVRTENDG